MRNMAPSANVPNHPFDVSWRTEVIGESHSTLHSGNTCDHRRPTIHFRTHSLEIILSQTDTGKTENLHDPFKAE